jgi:thiol-disulfide isomerase/thioredoxin
MNNKLHWLCLAAALCLGSCVTVPNDYPALPPGTWRAVLKLEPDMNTPNPKGKPLPEKLNLKYEAVAEDELPFLFEVVYDGDSSFHIEIINGDERIVVPAQDISFGRSRHRARDTVRINFPIYDSYITGYFAGHVIEGAWVVASKENYAIPFVATHGKDYRFTSLRDKTSVDLSGRWACTFDLESNTPYPAIAEFHQEGNHLTGTFQTETGDFRFLEGTVHQDRFFLSCFDGSHAYLFQGKIGDNNTLSGAFFSGKHYRSTWEGRRDEQFKLAHPDSLTSVNPGFETLNFAFPNADGKLVSLQDSAYQGKVKLVQIMGTWCPNCMDESTFLVEYLRDKKPRDLAVIALAFERGSQEKINKTLRLYKQRLKIPYEILHAGSNQKEEAARALPMLSRVSSFPTLLFIDKNNRIRKIHTGFYGPATSEYMAFTKEFDNFVKSLTAE